MSLILWCTGFFFLGMVLCVGIPILVGPQLPREVRQKWADTWAKLTMRTFDRAMLIRRKHGGYDLVASKFDSEKRGEKMNVNGNEKIATDPNTQMKLWKKKKFGMLYEKSDIITGPKVAELGKKGDEFVRSGENMIEQEGQKFFSTTLSVDNVWRFCDLASMYHAAAGSADPGDSETAETYTELSQAGFKSANLMDTIPLLLAFGAGVLAVFGLMQARSGGVGGGVRMPMMIDVMGVLL